MLFIGFAIRNPFSQRYENLWNKLIRVTKNTSIELDVSKNNAIIGGSFTITGLKQDHRGFSFDIDFLGYNLDFIYYDHRHHEYY